MAASDFSSKTERRARRDFTAEELLEKLSYDPESGIFRWRVRIMCYGGGKHPGDMAGTPKDGYVQINIFGKPYRAHHLAWLASYGSWPRSDMDVDHIDRNRSNNSISNLRLANRAQNNINSKRHRETKSGFRGVAKARNKWLARIKMDGKDKHLGVFERKEDAIAARIAAEKLYYPDFAED